MTVAELKNLTNDEEKVFQLIAEDKFADAIGMIKSGGVRINCLDKSGMNYLDQACFKGNEELIEFLIENGANVDNRAHDQGYTSLMFAAIGGKAQICQRLLDAGARPHAENTIGKTASELAAFVGQFDCVSVISSYIGLEDVEKIINPKGPDADSTVYPSKLVHFVHDLTKTHEVHPIRLTFLVMDEEIAMEFRAKILFAVDRLFEKQLRTRQPNEVMSVKLWIILFVLRELLKVMKECSKMHENDSNTPTKAATAFAKNLLQMSPEDLVRPNEEQFLRNAIMAFPYKHLMLYQTLSRAFSQIKSGQPPSAFIVICQTLFGHRFVETAHFCATCGISAAQKRCKTCKSSYCSEKCQRFDWPIHKKCCEAIKNRRVEQDENVFIPLEDAMKETKLTEKTEEEVSNKEDDKNAEENKMEKSEENETSK
ncbi:ankyrin repeats (3 copies) domain-containing protein [Ditylenchus destructor]|uniref:Ankyrin repeats (3 copies) domain-containing protein n=1 Tax=Ditylenchus destructor TaxID=166010 RepID=A0AAD4QWH9_9BILA|nr:ankyrin repeats (3 copies) domain-containing protein [Ditylenchus destructor]